MAAPGRTARNQVPLDETYHDHRIYGRRKKVVLLIGLLLLPISLAMIVRFDQGPDLGNVAQVTSTPTAVATLFEPPRETPLPTLFEPPRETPLPTLFEPPRETPLPTETATAVATLFEPPRETPLPTLFEPPRETPLPTLFEPPRQTPLPTLFEPPRQTPLPTGSVTAAPDVIDGTATTEQPRSTEATATLEGDPPKVLPRTGLTTELPMQSIGFALLFLSLMLIASALRRGNDA